MRKCRVVADAVWNSACHDVAVTVFMLQAFAIERGATRSTAQQEATRLHVTRSPCQITNALETKHRVIHIEGHHDAVVGAVAGGSSYPTAHATCFVDAFLQNLTRLVLAVVHHLVFIDRGVVLACWVVNTHLPEQTFHAKSTRFVHQNRHHTWPQCLVAQQLRQETNIRLRG